MKVLIIEDEPQALEGMKRIMERLDERFERIFFCDCAADALETIEEHRPELIVTDIILPDMTGLDLLEHVQSAAYEPKIIIVSGFDDFEYAKRGLKLGAVDYFLKPFDTDSFCRKLKECADWIEEERRERVAHDRTVELAHLGTRSMRDVFLLGLCLQRTYLQEHIVHRLQTWQLEWLAEGSYRVLALAVKAAGDKFSEKEEDVLSFATGNIVEELLADYAPSVAFSNAGKYWIIITPADDVGALAGTIGGAMLRHQKVKVGFGISEPAGSFQALHDAYRQAVDSLRAALLSKAPDIFYFDELKAHTVSRDEEIAACMTGAVATGDEEGIREAAEQFVRSLVMKGKAASPRDISQLCIDWVRNIQNVLRQRANLSLGEIPVALWDEMDECETMDELSAAMARYMADVAWKLKGLNKNSIIEQAMKLIHEKYAEDIGLQLLADELSIHPVWLSQLFKKEVGTNFLDYVTDLRIRKAKEWLRQSNLKIYEIAMKVGYQDVHHFGRLFKKKTGVTPKEFRYGK